jgi:hypothetical protein
MGGPVPHPATPGRLSNLRSSVEESEAFSGKLLALTHEVIQPFVSKLIPALAQLSAGLG